MERVERRNGEKKRFGISATHGKKITCKIKFLPDPLLPPTPYRMMV